MRSHSWSSGSAGSIGHQLSKGDRTEFFCGMRSSCLSDLRPFGDGFSLLFGGKEVLADAEMDTTIHTLLHSY